MRWYRFDGFEFDLQTGELTRNRRRVALAPQPARLLALLLERAGSLVEHAVICRHLWGDRIVEYDVGLHACVRRLRQSLGDEPGRPRYVETLPGRGYRFAAPVSRVDRHQRRHDRKLPSHAVAVAALATVGALAVTGWLVTRAKTIDGIRVESVSRLTATQSVATGADLSPDGHRFVYWSDDGGVPTILSRAVDDLVPVRLTADAPAIEPEYSPDGRWIAYSVIGEDPGLFVMDRDGGQNRRITHGEHYSPSWSPDGTRLAFSGLWHPGRPYFRMRLHDGIGIVEVDSGRTRWLEVGDAVEPAWSPRGDRLAYWATVGGRRDIYTTDLQGQLPVAVTDDEAIDYSPAWSVDGERLFFASTRGGAMAVWVVEIDRATGQATTAPRSVTTAGVADHGDVSVGEDGRVLYTEWTVASDLVRQDLDPRDLTPVGPPRVIVSSSSRFLEPDVSTDGRWIVYRTEGVQQDVFLVREDGNATRRLTRDPHKEWRPAFSHDGRRVAFYGNRSGSYEIWSVGIDGSAARRLTDTGPESVYDPKWSADGGSLVLFRPSVGASFVVDDSADPVARRLRRLVPSGHTFPPAFRVRDWSRDHGWLLGYSNSDRDVWVYAPAEQRFTRIADDGVPIQWLDARRALLLRAGRLHVVDIVTGEERTLLVGIPGDDNLVLTRDRRTLYYVQTRESADVVAADLQ